MRIWPWSTIRRLQKFLLIEAATVDRQREEIHDLKQEVRRLNSTVEGLRRSGYRRNHYQSYDYDGDDDWLVIDRSRKLIQNRYVEVTFDEDHKRIEMVAGSLTVYDVLAEELQDALYQH